MPKFSVSPIVVTRVGKVLLTGQSKRALLARNALQCFFGYKCGFSERSWSTDDIKNIKKICPSSSTQVMTAQSSKIDENLIFQNAITWVCSIEKS